MERTRERKEKARQGAQVKPRYWDHILYAETVLCSLPDTNSVVGADIFLYSIVGAD